MGIKELITFLIPAMLTVLLTVLLYCLEKKTHYGKLPYAVRQIITGILFGIITCSATEFGLQIPGAVINTRDAAPLCAGLLFGGPAGIISGLTGGIYRLFWGNSLANTFTAEWITTMFSVDAAGGFTRIACTVGTVCSGIFGAILRKTLFDNKRPTWGYGIIIALTTEVFHLFLVFVFRLNYLEKVYAVIKACSLPMIASNVITVAVAVILVTLLSSGDSEKNKKERNLARSFQMFLLFAVVIAFLITTFAMFFIQYKLGIKQTESLLNKNLEDLSERITLDGGIDNFIDTGFTWHVGKNGGIIIGRLMKDENGSIKEIVVVLNGEEYNKGEIIAAEQMTGGRVAKTAENFFSATIHINGTDTPIYGMYMFMDGTDKIVISYVPTEEAMLYQGVTVSLTIFFEILVFAALFVQIYYLVKKQVVENLNRVNGTLSEITDGNLDAVVDVRSHAEFASLSDDINQTVVTLKHYISEAAARIDKELEFAKAIQRSALPNVFPPYPGRTEFDIYATMNPAKEVGGDFYDFFFVGKNKLAFVVADVSGKGIPAAMFMMTAKTYIKGFAESGLPVEEVFTRTNSELCASNEAGMFVTSFMCIIDLETGIVSFADAGHNPPVICRNKGSFEYFRPRTSFVLAGMDGTKYRRGEIQLAPGDVIYLYTDGVTEAINSEYVLFGEERLLEALNGAKTLDVKSLCEKVKENMDVFVGEADQFDDITMVAFRYNGILSEKTITVDAEVANIDNVTEFINAELSAADCSKKAMIQIDVAIDEIFSNIANYAYKETHGIATVSIGFTENPKTAVITFKDSGVPYDPTKKEDPDTTLSADERQIGGLGIFMVKKSMDDMIYEYKNGENVLTIKKSI